MDSVHKDIIIYIKRIVNLVRAFDCAENKDFRILYLNKLKKKRRKRKIRIRRRRKDNMADVLYQIFIADDMWMFFTAVLLGSLYILWKF